MDGLGATAQTPGRTGASRVRAREHLSASAAIAILAAGGLLAAVLCAVVGYSLASQSDLRHAEIERAALSGRMNELRVLAGDGGELDPRVIQALGKSAVLKDLRFESGAPDDGRDMQPVVNGNGRIVGFLTWRADTPMTDLVNRLMPLVCIAAFILVGFAGFSLWQLRRARNDLAASEAQARAAAEQDAVTGLPNDAKMLSLLDEAMAARRGQESVTYALLGLNGMDGIVEHYGAHGGDEIMSVVATRLRDALPAGVICGRSAANGFAILACGEIDAAAMLRAVLDAAVRPYWIDNVVHISAHAGFAQAPGDATTRDELLRRAELALRAAHDKGPGAIIAFERALDTSASDQQFIRRELPRALSAGELEVHYQPIVAADGSRVTGVEALLRWTHKERGAIPPMQFIPVAEEMGLMDALGAFVLRRALAEAQRWPELYLAVNLSPLQARDWRIVEVVRGILAETGSEPSRLMLEVTEGVLIDNPDEMVKRIEELHALGVRIALDDFGSGYSNLGYLQRFPFDKLKVDKSFVSALGRSHNSGVIIQAIVALGRALGVTVVVEGVETEEQRVLLRLAGCDEMQGYLFAKPAPAKAIDKLVSQRKIGRAGRKAGKPAAA